MENKEIFIKKKFIDQNRKTDNSHIYWNNESLEKKKLFVDIDKLKSSQEQQFFINELDVIYLSKAFHHIESPIFLLRKLKDLLSDNGIIIITGKHYYSRKVYLACLERHFAKLVLRKKYRKTCSFFPEYAMLFPYSLEKGDLHYSLFNHDYFFKKLE